MLTAAAMVETRLLLPAAAGAPADSPLGGRGGAGAARCLFGPAEAGAVERLLRDQLAAERDRLLWRVGFQVVAALAGEDPAVDEDRPQPPGPGKAPGRTRPAPYRRQTTVKDFYRVQKAPAEKKQEAVPSRPSGHTCAEADAD